MKKLPSRGSSARPSLSLTLLAGTAASALAQANPQWVQSAPLTGGLHYGAAAFDGSRGRVQVFAGQDAALTVRNDTREWTGSSWILVNSASAAPAPRCFQGYSYDSGRQRLVMFGGLGAPGRLGDTWECKGGTWTPVTPVSAPSPRQSFGMAYDGARQKTVLFGGSTPTALGDTWVFDGTGWFQLSPAASPQARYEPAMAYDSERQRVVLFGGSDANGTTLGDTWEWDGTTWTQRSVTGPGPRYRAGIAYDTARRRTVLFGGGRATSAGAITLNDTWEWNGSSWVQTGSSGPSAREGLMMAYDPYRSRVVMVGGFSGNAETWEYYAPFWVAGQGLVSGSVPISATGSPGVGQNFTVSFTAPLGTSFLAMGAGPCLATPAPLGAPPLCAPGYIWVAPLLAISSSNGTFPLTVPNNQALFGQIVSVQGVSVQPAICPQPTDAMQITIQ